MKKLLALFMAVTTLVGGLTACGGNAQSVSTAGTSSQSVSEESVSEQAPDKTQEKFTLVVSCESGMVKPLQAAEEIFKQEYPNATVEYVTSSWGAGGNDLRYKQLILIAGEQSPDVGEMVWGKEFFQKDIILDLTNDVKSWDIYDDLTSGQLERITYGDKIYGITNSNNCPLLFYNKDILEKIGAEVPKTLDDVLAIAETIQTQNLKDASGNKIYTINFEGGNWTTDYWLWANGGKQMNDDYTKCAIDSEESIAAFTFMQDMIHKGYAPKVDGSGTSLFINGQMAFVLSGTWDIDSFKNVGLNFGITPLPTGSSGKNTVSAGGIEFGVFKASKHPEAAKAFLKAIASDAYYTEYLESHGTGTSNVKLYADAKVQKILTEKGWKEGYDAQQQQLANTAYNFLEAPFVYQEASKIYADALMRVLVKLEDPTTVMQEAAEKINTGIAEASK